MRFVRERFDPDGGMAEPSGWVGSIRLYGIIGEIRFTDEQIESLKGTELSDVRGIRFLKENGETTIELFSDVV